MTAGALHQPLPLAEWQNFYVIVGTSAGALIGLTFVVITIASDSAVSPAASARIRLLGLRAFITPTAVHLGAALGLSALLNVPGQTPLSLAACTGLIGAVGVVYGAVVVRWIRLMGASYQPVRADWVWNVVLPLIAYGCLLAASGLLLARARAGLYCVGAVAMVLLFVGIHNAWDMVAWMTTERHAAAEGKSAAAPEAAAPPPAGQQSPRSARGG